MQLSHSREESTTFVGLEFGLLFIISDFSISICVEKTREVRVSTRYCTDGTTVKVWYGK